MLKKAKNLRYFLMLLPGLFLARPVSAQVETVNTDNGFARLDQLPIVFANLTSAIATLAGFAVLIMLIRGGVAYITAQGDPKALATARGTLTWAIVGFVIILASYVIIAMIAGFVNLPFIGRFCIPSPGQDIGACT